MNSYMVQRYDFNAIWRQSPIVVAAIERVYPTRNIRHSITTEFTLIENQAALDVSVFVGTDAIGASSIRDQLTEGIAAFNRICPNHPLAQTTTRIHVVPKGTVRVAAIRQEMASISMRYH